MTLDIFLEETLRRVVREELRPILEQRGSATAEDRRVTLAEAAAAAGVSPSTVRKWAASGRVHSYGTGRAVRYSLSEVMAVVPDERPRAIKTEDRAEAIFRRKHV